MDALPPPPEETSQSVMDGGEGEEPLQGEIHTINGSIEVQRLSLADDKKTCDMIGFIKERNKCMEDEKSFPVDKCDLRGGESLEVPYISSIDQESYPKDFDDLSDDYPARNSSNQSDHSDGEHYYNDPIHSWQHDPYYKFMQERERRYHRYAFGYNARRNRWNDDFPFIHGLVNPQNSVVSHWSPPEPVCGKKKYTVGAGLSNPHHWTCFINCILQCMVHTVPLVLKLQKADHPDPCPRASTGFCCYCSLKLHADESIRLSGSSLYPESFIKCLKSISSDFDNEVQQDAQEFLHCLLEKLDEASVTPRSSEEPSPTEEGSIAKEIFGGRLKSELRCPECNHCSDKSETFLDLSLELNMVETLLDALQSFTKIELIEDFKCDGCKSRVSMEKQFKVEQAPKVLVIHLKRFTNFGGKIWDRVKYPLELDIKSFMSSSDDTIKKYNLYGVVEHLGSGQCGKGHYVCYIRPTENDWFELDDDKVRRYSEDGVLNSTAYLLFYVRQGSSPWFSTLLEKEEKEKEEKEDGLVNLAEQGTGESTSLIGPTSTLPDFSEHLQMNGNGYSLSDNLKECCRLVETSKGTQELSCLTGLGDKNENFGRWWDPSGQKKDVNPMGSLDDEEMKRITHGSLEVDCTVTEELNCLTKSGNKIEHAGRWWEPLGKKKDVSPRGSLDRELKDVSLRGSLDRELKDVSPRGLLNREVEQAVTQGGSPRKDENSCSLLLLSDKYEDHCHGKNSSLQGGGEEGREAGRSKKRKSVGGGFGECKAVRKLRNRKHRAVARHFPLCRRRAMARAAGKSKMRRRSSTEKSKMRRR